MNRPDKYKFRLFFATMVVWVIVCTESKSQGRVILNEYYVSQNGGCYPFIELKNLGPGRQDIGCYIIANENYSITIPANTPLNPGDIYLIAGLATITGCGITASKTVDLNWVVRNDLTSDPLTTPLSFFGNPTGNKSFPLILLDGNQTPPTIIDAVRSQGNELVPTNPITTKTVGTCQSKSLPAITLDPSYKFEEIGNKPGDNASLARTIDGGCGWAKTPTKQSPGLSNTDLSGATAISASEANNLTCNTSNQTFNSTKTITITPTPTSLKPISYSTVFSLSSTFSTSTLYTPITNLTTSSIIYNNLAAGYYNMLFEPTDTTCGQLPYPIVVYNPLLNISASPSPNCPTNNPAPNGTATITISNPSSTPSNYYSLSYSVLNTTLNQTITPSPDPTKSSSPILLSSLSPASYKITVKPNYGCENSTTFNIIETCSVPIKLINFAAASTLSNNKFEINIDADAELKELILESSNNAKSFFKVADIPFENKKGDQKITFEIPHSVDEFFRLVMIDIFGNRITSEIIRIKNNIESLDIKVFPNPFQDYISLQHFTRNDDILIACLLSVNGAILKEENFKLAPGMNNHKLSTAGLSKGTYILSLKKISSPNIQFSNVVKQ